MAEQDVPVIAIDGPSGSGKGVIAWRVARALGYHILDSGALYRLIGLAARKHGVSFDDQAALTRVAAQLDVEFVPTDHIENPLAILLEGEPVTDAVRTDEAGTDASRVAAVGPVREAIRGLQREFKQPPGLVADGRDMGTVVFNDAFVKIYLTASAQARAERRYKQLIDKGISVSLHDLFLSIQARDERDMNRAVAPLKPAEDAVIVDSTRLTIDEVFDRVMSIVTKRIG